jgi:hypothetical protein
LPAGGRAARKMVLVIPPLPVRGKMGYAIVKLSKVCAILLLRLEVEYGRTGFWEEGDWGTR